MDCEGFLTHIDEFVDGIPGVADNPTRVAHVETCARCQARVRELEAVSSALHHAWSHVAAPATLRAQVRRALAEESSAGGRSTLLGAGSSGSAIGPLLTRPGYRRPRLVLMTLAVAAVVVLALGTWQVFGPRRAMSPVVSYVENGILRAALERHSWCSREEHVFHRDGDLPSNLPGIASTLKGELGLEVLAPTLRKWGYSFVGARRCRVASRPVAHLLYFAPRGAITLSLFSMYRVHDLGTPSSDDGAHQYFSLSGPGGSVLAWNDGSQTYALIGGCPQADLVSIGESLRGPGAVATLPTVPESLAAFAP